MKKIIFITALLLSAGIAVAQDHRQPQGKPAFQKIMPGHLGMRPFSVNELNGLMKNELQLDDKQMKKVEKLNKKYAKIIEGEKPKDMPKGDRGFPGGGPGGRGGFPGGGPGGGFPSGGPGGGFPGGGQGKGPGGGFPGGGPQGAQGQSAETNYDALQEKYDKKLVKILSEAQYAGYQKIRPKFYSQRRFHDFLFGGQQM